MNGVNILLQFTATEKRSGFNATIALLFHSTFIIFIVFHLVLTYFHPSFVNERCQDFRRLLGN